MSGDTPRSDPTAEHPPDRCAGRARASPASRSGGARHQDEPPAERLQHLYADLKHDARTAIANGQDVVVDLSSADRGVRDEWRAFADDVSADLRLVVLTAPFEVLWQRVKKRNDQKQANAVRFTESRLRAYVDGFDWPTDDEHPTVVTTG